jgi:hypothetical protein
MVDVDFVKFGSIQPGEIYEAVYSKTPLFKLQLRGWGIADLNFRSKFLGDHRFVLLEAGKRKSINQNRDPVIYCGESSIWIGIIRGIQSLGLQLLVMEAIFCLLNKNPAYKQCGSCQKAIDIAYD